MNTLCKNPFRRYEIIRQNSQNTQFQADEQKTDTDNGKIHMLEVDRITPNPSQPRLFFEDEPIIRLADSIRQYGILQPLSVRRLSAFDKQYGSSYEIIAGERRYRAAKLLNLKQVPCIIIDVDSKRSAELALVENIQREDLNIFEQASAIASLIDIYSLTQEQVARRLSSSQSHIANKLRLLKLTPEERELILRCKLTERHARALLKIDDHELRIKAIEQIAAKELNVSATESYIESLLYKPEERPQCSRQTKGVLRDIRFFYNTVDRALLTLNTAGITATSERKERDSETEIIIHIQRP